MRAPTMLTECFQEKIEPTLVAESLAIKLPEKFVNFVEKKSKRQIIYGFIAALKGVIRKVIKR